MGFIISTILLDGTNRKSHGQNSVLLNFLESFEKSSQDLVYVHPFLLGYEKTPHE